MILYDIHTHKKQQEKVTSEYSIRSLVSVSPLSFLSYAEKSTDDKYFSCGIHPWDAHIGMRELDMIKDVFCQEEVIAIGEVGLDKLKGAPLQEQKEIFEKQIQLANQFEKPLIIHCVKAWDQLIALYKEYNTAIPWILHGYRGGVEQTKQLARLGFKFSIGHNFNFDSLAHIPLDSVFCETDDSDVTISKVYERLSLSLGVEFEQLVEIVADNVGLCLKKMTK